MWPEEVAHALVRAVSRLFSTPCWGTDSLPGRRKCVRHIVTTELWEKCGLAKG
jgi:hypothetical protein